MTYYQPDMKTFAKGEGSLPTEQEMTSCLNNLIVSNPYDEKFLVENFGKTLAQLMAKKSDDPDDKDYVPDWNITDISIVAQFLDHTVALAPYKLTKMGAHSEEDDDDNTVPSIPETWSDTFRDGFEKVGSDRHWNTKQMSQASNLRYAVFSSYESWLHDCATKQRQALCQQLHIKGYVKKFNEVELRHEIAVRKRQFPGQDVFLFCGSRINEYYRAVTGKNVFEGATLIEVNLGGHWREEPDKFLLTHYESAVVAQGQVKANHLFTTAYHLERIPRYWNVKTGAFMSFGIEVPPRVEEQWGYNTGGQGLLFK